MTSWLDEVSRTHQTRDLAAQQATERLRRYLDAHEVDIIRVFEEASAYLTSRPKLLGSYYVRKREDSDTIPAFRLTIVDRIAEEDPDRWGDFLSLDITPNNDAIQEGRPELWVQFYCHKTNPTTNIWIDFSELTIERLQSTMIEILKNVS